MPAPRLYRANAIVLKHLRLGEADRILTLLSSQHGKFRAVVKGVVKTTSRMAGHLEPLTRSDLLVARGRNLDIVTQAQTLESFRTLREDLAKASAALYAFELVDRFTEEHNDTPELFSLVLDLLRWLSTAAASDLPLRWFEMQLLELLGFRPELYACLDCREELEPRAHYFSPQAGGVLCARCAGEGVRPLSLNALKVLRLLQRDEVAPLQRARLDAPLLGEVEGTLRQYIAFILEREVRSALFLDQLRGQQLTRWQSPSRPGAGE